jgi:hypothetical protein
MANRKTAVYIGDDQLDAIQALVASGRTASIQAFVADAIRVALLDAAEWIEMLDDGLRQTGGPLTRKECQWADAILTSSGRHSRK